MTYLLFFVALSLSAVAAWYAVAGLVAIFAAATIPIVIMGSLLEASKLVVASWLYRNWKEIPFLMKSYFTVALLVLMMLTSMGIFGFLSKAHLDQAVPTGEAAAKLALIDERINQEKENLNASRAELNQLDQAVNQIISRTEGATDTRAIERSIQVRRSQQRDRARLLDEIGKYQTKIAELQEERAPLASEVRKVEAEVGPIKYIAALIYEESADEEVLEKAVRFVTILIVLVFDPLAVLLLIAANWNLKHKTKSVKNEEDPIGDMPLPETKQEETTSATEQEITEEEIPEIKIDEHQKDWEPNLFDRVSNRKEVGRYLAETGKKPAKVQSFLSKVQDIFNQSTEKTIEKEVDDLQKK
jgi:uncharacterized protein YlxW (UPF0749 family)